MQMTKDSRVGIWGNYRLSIAQVRWYWITRSHSPRIFHAHTIHRRRQTHSIQPNLYLHLQSLPVISVQCTFPLPHLNNLDLLSLDWDDKQTDNQPHNKRNTILRPSPITYHPFWHRFTDKVLHPRRKFFSTVVFRDTIEVFNITFLLSFSIPRFVPAIQHQSFIQSVEGRTNQRPAPPRLTAHHRSQRKGSA